MTNIERLDLNALVIRYHNEFINPIDFHRVMSEAIRAQRSEDELEEALREYGRHLDDCYTGTHCICGLHEALTGGKEGV